MATADGKRSGFDGVTVYNDMLYQPAWLPLLEIARTTKRVRIGPAAVNPFTCHPINIAASNTEGDDITPFFHGRSQSLYFSSNGFQNMGGHDVYRSRKQGKDWGTPQHLGYPVNSSYDDIYYSVDSENGKNYLVTHF